MSLLFSHVAALEHVIETARNHNHRYLFVISGEETWVKQTLSELLVASGLQDIVSISEDPLGTCLHLSANQLHHHLGKEYANVIWDGFSGLDPDGLGIASGFIKGGGLFGLLLPSLDQMAAKPDPAYRSICQSQNEFEQLNTHFLTRLKSCLESDPSVLLIQQDKPHINARPACSAQQPSPLPLPTNDQVKAIAAIKKVAFGHRHRPLVITSDRGRGKSSTLGMAAAEIWLATQRTLFITAPNRQTCAAAFDHFQHTITNQAPDLNKNSSAKGLQFIALDALETLESGSMLLVDEAAAIPVAILSNILKLSSRVVFASTIHGYEGHGRGFAIRFEKTLNQRCPGWQQITLTTPIRWALEDPLESFINRFLLLNATPDYLSPQKIECSSPFDKTTLSIRSVTQAEIADNEALLTAVFSLLVSAHYQTSPSDLRFILDHPRVNLYLAEYADKEQAKSDNANSSLMGVCLVVKEGGLNDTELFEGLISGQRRLRGQLFPQALAMSSAEPGFLQHTTYRIMRIAVDPDYQQQGIGSHLLDYVAQDAQTNFIDSLSTSFGMSDELVQFWQSNHFVAVKLGLKKEGASGLNSLMMMRALSEASNTLLEQRKTEFAEDITFALRSHYQHLDSNLAERILQNMKTVTKALSVRDIAKIHAFAKGNRAYEETERLIHQFVLNMIDKKVWCSLEDSHRKLLIMRTLQNRSTRDIERELNLSGKKQVENAIRVGLASLIIA